MPLVVTSKVLGRTIKPTGLVLMNTMVILGIFAILDLGLVLVLERFFGQLFFQRRAIQMAFERVTLLRHLAHCLGQGQLVVDAG